jgi:hypothetical protein
MVVARAAAANRDLAIIVVLLWLRVGMTSVAIVEETLVPAV